MRRKAQVFAPKSLGAINTGYFPFIRHLSEDFAVDVWKLALQRGLRDRDHQRLRRWSDVIYLLAHGESLYICRWLDADEQKETGHRYGISLIEGNHRTNLPVYSWLYQVVGDRILYLEEGTNALKYYDRKTEETGSLAENVFTFSVFADRYICIEGYNEAPKVYDLTTGICNEVTIE